MSNKRTRLLLAATAAAGLFCVPAAAQEEAAAHSAQDKIFQDLESAQKLYLDGMGQFQQGNIRTARRYIRKSFDILASLIVEEGIGDRVQPEIESLLQKIRTAEVGSEPTAPENPSSLDIEPGEIVSSTQSVVADTSRYTIRVDPQDRLVQQVLATYTGPRFSKVQEALGRSGRYRDLVMSILRENRLPRELFYLMMVESEYKHNAYSRAGAAGLWQLMPATARKLGLKVSYWVDERYDPELATRAALKYLKELYQHFDDWHLALAAYNRGEHGIGRDLKFTRATDFSEPQLRSAVPRETEYFVPKFMACALIGDYPEKFGLKPDYEKPDEYDVVTVDKPLDLKIAAECAGTTEKEINRLNPSIRAWCTPINYPNFQLRIPKGTKKKFEEALEKVKDWNPTRGFVRHKVRSGDALSVIARRYRTSVDTIMRENNIRNARLIRPGQMLNIRPGRGYFIE